jgi:lipopolysaccharide transport system permease protein
MAVCLTGASLALSALQVHFRDVGLAMPVILQIWMFASPVLYPLSRAKSTLPAPLYAAYLLNPMAGIVDTVRRTVVLLEPPDLQALGIAALVAAATVPIGYMYFKLTERTMADIV